MQRTDARLFPAAIVQRDRSTRSCNAIVQQQSPGQSEVVASALGGSLDVRWSGSSATSMSTGRDRWIARSVCVPIALRARRGLYERDR